MDSNSRPVAAPAAKGMLHRASAKIRQAVLGEAPDTAGAIRSPDAAMRSRLCALLLARLKSEPALLAALAEGKHSMFADKVLFRALRDRLGFTRLRSAATGGAALGPDTFKFFQAMGVPLRTLYGQTELLGAYTLHPEGKVDPDTTGIPMADNIEIRLDNADVIGVGEIVVRHPNMFHGYYKNPEACEWFIQLSLTRQDTHCSIVRGFKTTATIIRSLRDPKIL